MNSPYSPQDQIIIDEHGFVSPANERLFGVYFPADTPADTDGDKVRFYVLPTAMLGKSREEKIKFVGDVVNETRTAQTFEVSLLDRVDPAPGNITPDMHPNLRGLTVEANLAAAMAPLKIFQSKGLACAENAIAIEKIHEAMEALARRRRNRAAQKVEGTMSAHR